MPITYHIDPKRNLVTVEAHGALRTGDYIDTRTRLADDPQLEPGMDQLLDFRDVERHELSIELYSRFVELERSLQDRFGDCRIAVVTRSDLHYGFTQMFVVEMMDVRPDYRVFREFEQAERWLFGKEQL
jgi:hypothetical protein